MNKIIVTVIVSAVSVGGAWADSSAKPSGTPHDPMLAKCEALKRQADRNVCITAAVKNSALPASPQPVVSTPPPPSQKELSLKRAEAVFSAAAAVRSVTNSGVSYEQYGPYVQSFAIALDQYRLAIQEPVEKDAAAALSEALTAFQDASTYWWKDIDFSSRSRNRQSYPFALPTGLANTEELVRKYRIPVRNADLFGFHSGTERGEALRTIWSFGSGRADHARALLNDIGKPPTPPEPTRTVFTTRIANPSDDLLRIIDAALLKEGCFKSGGLKEEDPRNGMAHFWAECTHGQRQNLACSETSCIPFDDAPEQEEWMKAENKT